MGHSPETSQSAEQPRWHGYPGPWVPTRRPAASQWLLRPLVPASRASWDVVGVDTEGWASNPKMLSFSGDGETAYVIPAHAKKTLRWFAEWIRGRVVVMHNGLHDRPVLRAMGVEIGPYHDTQVMAYHHMIRTGSGALEAEAQNLGTLAYRELGLRLGELSEIAGVDFDTQTIPESDAVLDYAGLDSIAARRLYDVYDGYGIVGSIPYQIDMGQVPLVEQMIGTGLPFDLDAALDYYGEVLDKLEMTMGQLRTTAQRRGLRDFNPGSHDQVRELLTRKIGLRIRKRTKGGKASTNEKALADHRSNPVVAEIQSYRELQKLHGTYLLPLIKELSQ